MNTISTTITKEEAITTITTIAKYLAMWGDHDSKIEPRVATIMSFVDYINEYGYPSNIKEQADWGRGVNCAVDVDDTTMWLLVTVLSSLFDEAMWGDGYTGWLDTVTYETGICARELIAKVRR